MKFKILIAVVVVGLVLAISSVWRLIDRKVEQWKSEETVQTESISKMGYSVGDVEVYLKMIGSDKEDFIKSQSIRKNYELFRDGKTSTFTEQAINKKRDDDRATATACTAIAAAATFATLNNITRGGSR